MATAQPLLPVWKDDGDADQVAVRGTATTVFVVEWQLDGDPGGQHGDDQPGAGEN